MDFEALYRQQKEGVFNLALRLLKDRDRAMDATQEAFTRAFQARDKFRGDCRPSTWLYRIAYNVCLSMLEGRAGHSPLDDGLERPDPARSRPEAAAERRETDAAVARALERLGEEDRRLLCLMMEEEMGYEELAHVLGCTVEAVRMRACRARRKLREILEPLLGKAT